MLWYAIVVASTLQCSEGTPDSGVLNLPVPVDRPITSAELQQQAVLDGAYAEEVRIEGKSWKANTSRQEIALLLGGRGLKNIRQVEFVLEPHPASAFDLTSASFVPQDPFLTFGVGVEHLEDDRLRIGAASVSTSVDGDQTFGTFTLRTSDTFTSLTSALLEVSFLSLGPSSSDRDEYMRGDLRLGVVVND